MSKLHFVVDCVNDLLDTSVLEGLLAVLAGLRHHRLIVLLADPGDVDSSVLDLRPVCPESCYLCMNGVGKLCISDNGGVVSVSVDPDAENSSTCHEDCPVSMAALAVLCDLRCLVESSLVLSGQLGLVVEIPSWEPPALSGCLLVVGTY